jgi:hypothetical protein
MFANCVALAATCLIAAVIPAQASGGCLTKGEARQRFPASHLYWHGKDHCWDASAGAISKPTLTHSVRRQESRTLAVGTRKPSDEDATIGLSSSPANPSHLPPASVLPASTHEPNALAMAETIETTPWINRWPDQPIKPPSRPAVAEAAADAALAGPRGMVAGIMALVLSLALLEILFGGTKLRTRLMFGRNNQDTRSRWAAARRVGPKTSSRSTRIGAIARKLILARLLPTLGMDRGWKRRNSDIIVR